MDDAAIPKFHGYYLTLWPSQFIYYIHCQSEIERDKIFFYPSQKAMNRPDLIARVFYLKKQEFLRLIKEKGVLSRFCGDIYTIKYQKRGLPHMHLLLFLYLENQIFDAAKIDEIVSAELPTEENDLTGELFGIVSSVMLHSLCGYQNPNAPYMKRSDHNSPECTK